MVEHRPVLPADIHDDFAEFVPDEVRQSFMVSQQELGQAAADLHFVLRWDPEPHLIDQVLEEKQTPPPNELILDMLMSQHFTEVEALGA